MEPTPLETRIQKTQPGQVTWAEPKLGKTCAQCVHFTTNADDTHRQSIPDGKGICTLCYKKADKSFKPTPFRANAIACSQFR